MGAVRQKCPREDWHHDVARSMRLWVRTAYPFLSYTFPVLHSWESSRRSDKPTNLQSILRTLIFLSSAPKKAGRLEGWKQGVLTSGFGEVW